MFHSLVSAKAFYKQQPLVNFLCEVLNVGAQDLDNPRLFDDKRKFYQLKDAIIGKAVVLHTCIVFLLCLIRLDHSAFIFTTTDSLSDKLWSI